MLRWLVFIIVPLAWLCSGCATDQNASDPPMRMFAVAGQFARGREDGKREAKASWTEHNAAWMWLWMMDEEYRRGHSVGWAEGRAEVRIEESRQETLRDMKR